MKQTLLLFFAIILSTGFIFAQCPTGYTANGQAGVDNFAALYPDCTEILGNLFVFGDITNLDAFSNVTTINGNLTLSAQGVSLNTMGMSSVTNILGDFVIQGNNSLTSLNGFSSLESVGGNLLIDQNSGLLDLSGLNSLTSIGGDVDITNNPSLMNLLQPLAVTTIIGDLNIFNNNSLISLEGLNNLQSVGVRLFVGNSSSLVDISALSSLQTIGERLIVSATNCSSLTGLENIQSIGTILTIQLNENLQNIDALNHPISIGTFINITNNTQLSDCAVQAVCDLIAVDPALVSANGNATGCAFSFQVEEACNCAGEDLDYTTSLNPCGSYTFMGTDYTQSGTYLVPYTNSAGCSGTVTLNLNFIELEAEMQVNGNILTAVGNHININWLDCNNNFEPVIGEVFNEFIVEQAGSYAFEVSLGNCTFQSECQTVVFTSVDQSLKNSISVFPNPVKDVLRINNTGNVALTNLKLFNISGKLLSDFPISGLPEFNFDISSYDAGIYILELFSNVESTKVKIVKK